MNIRVTDEQIEEMKKGWDEGLSIRKIAEKVKLSPCHVRYWQEMGFKRLQLTDTKRALIVQLHKEGVSLRVIAKDEGVALSTVWLACHVLPPTQMDEDEDEEEEGEI